MPANHSSLLAADCRQATHYDSICLRNDLLCVGRYI